MGNGVGNLGKLPAGSQPFFFPFFFLGAEKLSRTGRVSVWCMIDGSCKGEDIL